VNRKLVFAALVAVALLVLLLIFAAPREPPVTHELSGPVAMVEQVEREAAGSPPPRSAPAAPRTRLPRPAIAAAAGGAVTDASASAAGSPASAPIRISQLGGKLRDRRDDPGPDAPGELELIHAGLDTIAEDIEACLAEWSQSGGQAEGEVMLAFQLDESGLADSWVVDPAELPFGVKTCFANAVYGVDWSHVVRKPAEITQRFTVSRDGGASGVEQE
jgi:hypothetical protein